MTGMLLPYCNKHGCHFKNKLYVSHVAVRTQSRANIALVT